jgi:hypothetical protein
MKTHEESDFLAWARTHGMGLDRRWPDAAVLKFSPDQGLARFWAVPEKPERRSHFISAILDLTGEPGSVFAWRHQGSWPATALPARPNDLVEHQILRGLGMPLGTSAIIEFEQSERAALVTLLFATTVFGWSTGQDLYVVPHHARQIMKVSHHGVVHVDFREAADMERMVAGMEDAGYHLPEEPPDPTFKRPGWMKSG